MRPKSLPTAPEVVVTTTDEINIMFSNMTIDAQEALLLRIDPARWTEDTPPPLHIHDWNRRWRRVQREKHLRHLEIASKRRHCFCNNCSENHRPPFPFYYVVRRISYECWLEKHQIDHEIEEFLVPLRNQGEHVGSVRIA